MTGIIIKPGKGDNPILPNTGDQYDPNVAQDHTDQRFSTRAALPEKAKRDPKYDPGLLMKSPAWMGCPTCREVDRWRVLADSSPDGDGLIQLYCGKCGSQTPVLAMGQPQVSDYIARRLGIHVPDPLVNLTFDPRGE